MVAVLCLGFFAGVFSFLHFRLDLSGLRGGVPSQSLQFWFWFLSERCVSVLLFIAAFFLFLGMYSGDLVVFSLLAPCEFSFAFCGSFAPF